VSVSPYYLICVLIPLYVCPNTTTMCPYTTPICVSLYYHICVLILLGNGGSWGGSVRHFQLFLWRGWWAPAPAEDAGVCVLCVCVRVWPSVGVSVRDADAASACHCISTSCTICHGLASNYTSTIILPKQTLYWRDSTRRDTLAVNTLVTQNTVLQYLN
jgi:hypothetical protein